MKTLTIDIESWSIDVKTSTIDIESWNIVVKTSTIRVVYPTYRLVFG